MESIKVDKPLTMTQEEKQSKCLYGRTYKERLRSCEYCSVACPARIPDFDTEQFSLPSNLDEAAEKIASDIAPTHPDIDWDECFEKIKEGIKAGAEWMAGQGETHEHYVIREVADHDIGPAIVCYPDTFEIGDKVVVQIRKK